MTPGAGKGDTASDTTVLAKLRTQLALDRTTLAWIRTTLTFATFGFGTIAFFRTLRERYAIPESVRLHENALRFGVALLVLCILSTIFAGVSHWLTLRRLRQKKMIVLTPWPLSITVAMLLGIVGLVLLYGLLSG